MIFKKRTTQQGFVMPMVLIMMTTLMIVAILINQAIVVNQRQITRYGYVLIARAAAKAAVDYAKEELDSNLSYCGTAENRNSPSDDQDSTVLYSDSSYQVTYQVEIYDNVCSGNARNIRAIGRVYIPDVSLNVAYVQDIRVRLVRSGLYTESPGDFSPVAWYRSDQTNSVLQTTNSSSSNNFGFDTVHEEQTNGTTQNAVCSNSNNDLEFHTGNENSGTQNIGVEFDNVTIPPGATITDAYIQFRSRGINGTGGTSAQLSQSLTTRIRAFDTNSKSDFTCPGNNQLNNTSALTTQTVDWAMPAWSTQNQQGSAQQTPNITSLVQAVVDRSGWSSGNSMGFHFARVSGSGLRNASKLNQNHLQLYVEWTTGATSTPATNGTTVTQWSDQTANANHLLLANGNPLLRTNTLNSKQVIEFQATGDSPDVLASNSSFTPEIQETAGMTVVAVMRPINTGSSTGNDRYLSFISNNQPNGAETPAEDGSVHPFVRSALTNNVAASAYNYTPQALSNAVGSSFGGTSWGVYAFTISNSANERFSRNGSPSSLFAGGNQTNFELNRLMLGGTSDGSGSYTLPGDMQIAELVVYDKPLSCSQLRLIENYYEQASSWNVSSANYNCPLQ